MAQPTPFSPSSSSHNNHNNSNSNNHGHSHSHSNSSSIPASTKQTIYSTRSGIAKGSSQSVRHQHLRTRSSDYGLSHLHLASNSSYIQPSSNVSVKPPTLRHYHSLSDQSLSDKSSQSSALSSPPILLPAVNLGSSPMPFSPGNSSSPAASMASEVYSNAPGSHPLVRMPDEQQFIAPLSSNGQQHNQPPSSQQYIPAGSLEMASMSTTSNASSSLLKASSFGSTSSLMSFEDPNNSMYANRLSRPTDSYSPQRQNFTNAPAYANVARPVSSSLIPPAGTTPGASGNLHYNPHSSPRLQNVGGGYPQQPSGSNLQQSSTHQADLLNSKSPSMPYSPMMISSPVTPKINSSANPWGSPMGTPSNHPSSPGQGAQGQNITKQPQSSFPPPPQPQIKLHRAPQPPAPAQQHPQETHFASSPLRQQMASSTLNSGLLGSTISNENLPLQQQPQAGQYQQHQQQTTAPIRQNMVHHNSTSQIQPHLSPAPQPPAPPVSYVLPSSIAPPTFHRIRSKSELAPVINPHPKYRRALPEGGSLSPLAALTKQLPTTYHICNPAFNYQSSKNPRRILTKPGEGKLNNGFDNADSDYILYVNDILGIDEQRRYVVLSVFYKSSSLIILDILYSMFSAKVHSDKSSSVKTWPTKKLLP